MSLLQPKTKELKLEITQVNPNLDEGEEDIIPGGVFS
jgi:hypothetical protein